MLHAVGVKLFWLSKKVGGHVPPAPPYLRALSTEGKININFIKHEEIFIKSCKL